MKFKMLDIESNRHKIESNLIKQAKLLAKEINNLRTSIDQVKANFDGVVCTIFQRCLLEKGITDNWLGRMTQDVQKVLFLSKQSIKEFDKLTINMESLTNTVNVNS